MRDLLIAVKSCLVHRHTYHDPIRKTWGAAANKFPGVHTRFFVGNGSDILKPLETDEIYIDVPDDYDGLPVKTREILAYSLDSGYEFTFLCDTDTFLIPLKLLLCDYDYYDYSGRFGTDPAIGSTFYFVDGRKIHHPECHPWASGGLGYFLSRKAAQIIVSREPKMWAEDMWTGHVLGPHIQSGEIKAYDIPNFDAGISWHYQAHRLGWNKDVQVPIWMRKMYEDCP